MNLCHASIEIRPRADVLADEKEAFDRRKGEGEGTQAHNRGGLEKRTSTEDRFCGRASRSKKLYGRPPKPKRRGGRTSRVVVMAGVRGGEGGGEEEAEGELDEAEAGARPRQN